MIPDLGWIVTCAWVVFCLAFAAHHRRLVRPARLVALMPEGLGGRSPTRAVRWGHLRRRSRTEQLVASSLPDVVDLFLLAVVGGLNVTLAVEEVARRAPPPMRPALGLVADQMARGARTADALAMLPGLAGDSTRPLVAALVAAERYGAPLLPALERVASEARVDRRRRADEAARRVPVKLLFPLVLCLLPAFTLLTVAPLLAGTLRSLHL
ncbi:MAG: type II secretion system F family protein [Acidimicrobiales bacterium]